MPAHRYVTLHPPMPTMVSEAIFGHVRDLATKYGLKCWIDPIKMMETGELVIMVDLPEVWCQRAATAKELAFADQLLEDGKMEQFRDFVRRGLPPAMR